MLAALNVGAVVMGIASGGLAASITALGLGAALTVLGVGSGADIGLVTGVLLGFAVTGYVTGARTAHSARFHGQIAGLGLAAIVVLVARLGGSPAGTLTVIWLAVLAVIVSGSASWYSGRRKSPRP